MRLGNIGSWTLLVLLGLAHQAIQAAGIGWPEAVARLAGERAKAETCVALLKRYGNDSQIANGQLAYVTAKTASDAAISGLITVLAQGNNPQSLPSLEARLQQGTSGLAEFCGTVNDLLPSTSGQRGAIADIARAAIEPLVNTLSEAVSALYNNHRKDDALTRLTIQTQLEAAKWPDFAEVRAAER